MKVKIIAFTVLLLALNSTRICAKSRVKTVTLKGRSSQLTLENVKVSTVHSFTVSPEDAQKLKELSLKELGKKVIIEVDGKTLASPVVRAPLEKGIFEITEK